MLESLLAAMASPAGNSRKEVYRRHDVKATTAELTHAIPELGFEMEQSSRSGSTFPKQLSIDSSNVSLTDFSLFEPPGCKTCMILKDAIIARTSQSYSLLGRSHVSCAKSGRNDRHPVARAGNFLEGELE
jgi:hypothetical protein